jgi:hypothetical protein
MKSRNLIFSLFIILPFMAEAQQPKKNTENIRVQRMQFTETEDDPETPPPPYLPSRFKTPQEWLINLYQTEKPKKTISRYNIDLYESEGSYMLGLTGVNTYVEGNNHTATRTEFSPKESYFALPQSYFKNLSREQVLSKITSELKSFSRTTAFKTSYFSQADKIVFQSNGETIWSK